MADTEQVAQLVLKLLDARPPIGEPTAVHNLADPLQEPFFIADIRTTDVEGLLEALLASEDGKIVDYFLS
jgi:hypothetical protein